MQIFPKIALVYLSYGCERHLDDVISALKRLTYPKERIEFVVVDNPHPESGSSLNLLRQALLPLSGREIPHVTLLPQNTNLGFPAGNNVGIRWAVEAGFDYIYLHNDDGFVASNFLEPLVSAMEADKSIGVAQSMILLHPETELINTSGNSFQYLGFGYCGNFRKNYLPQNFREIFDIIYASGAAMLVRSELLKRFGLLDEDYFLYHEDIEYSFRLKAAGYRIVTVRDSVFYHKYHFSRQKEKMYWIERNRYGLMLTYLKLPTLFLLAPMAIVLEFALLIFALKNGWIKQKAAAYRYWLRAANWRLWLAKKRRIRQIRTISDREFSRRFVGSISFGEKQFDSPVLRYIGNPLMTAYWFIVKQIIFW